MTMSTVLLAAVTGYLLGSIPSGLLLSRLAGLGDIREIGSGNIGATNVLRTGSKAVAAATLFCDVVKGIVAIALARHLLDGSIDHGAGGIVSGWTAAHVAGGCAFLGHLFPAWLAFKGGKGVATYIGVAAGLVWPAAVAFCAIWLITALVLRYSSLSALLAAIAAPVAAALYASSATSVLLIILSMLLILKHRDNIRRLRSGEEPKIGEKSGRQDEAANP